MKSEKEIAAIYMKLLKIYFSNFMEEKVKKIPHNCIFNVQHPLDIVETIDGEPNPNYNKLGHIRIPYQTILEANETHTTFLVPYYNGSNIVSINNKHFQAKDSMQFIFMPVEKAEKYDLQDMTPHIGLCKLSLDKEEITVCDAETDAKECPAFVNVNTRETLKKEFWKYAKKYHNDLIVLKDILNRKETLTFWQKLSGYLSFK